MDEALTKENGDARAALLYYHGGPNWRSAYGPESAGYVPAITAHYQALAQADAGNRVQLAQADTGSMTDAGPAATAAGAPAASVEKPRPGKKKAPFTPAQREPEPKPASGGAGGEDAFS